MDAVEGTVTVTAMNLKWRPAAAGGGRQVNSNTSLCFGLLFFSCRANLVKLRLPNQIYSVWLLNYFEDIFERPWSGGFWVQVGAAAVGQSWPSPDACKVPCQDFFVMIVSANWILFDLIVCSQPCHDLEVCEFKLVLQQLVKVGLHCTMG